MQTEASDWIVGVMMSAFGLVGLFLAAGARDDEMYVFGFSLLLFAIIFVAAIIKRTYDVADAATAMSLDHG